MEFALQLTNFSNHFVQAHNLRVPLTTVGDCFDSTACKCLNFLGSSSKSAIRCFRCAVLIAFVFQMFVVFSDNGEDTTLELCKVTSSMLLASEETHD